ncbi:hypothetical protein TH62_14460 [Bacillus sp. TH008]|nr:hypothetical protein TH62_14460 [Bacillus sp. TH008]
MINIFIILFLQYLRKLFTAHAALAIYRDLFKTLMNHKLWDIHCIRNGDGTKFMSFSHINQHAFSSLFSFLT